MARPRLTIILSQAQGKHPGKRALEEAIVAALILEPGLDVSVIPYLYDIGADHSARLFLESARGDLVVLSWLYPRAAFWVLDRDGIKGRWGETQLKPPADDDDEEAAAGEPEPPRGIGAVDVPERAIYCLDLRDFNSHNPYLEEIRRIAAEVRAKHESQQAKKPAIVELSMRLLRTEPAVQAVPETAGEMIARSFSHEQLLRTPGRRWYPVIDYSRCTNCLECLDFCLFGVYGVDGLDRIAVENQDNCKKGCPACSRVCPEQAIIFPDYKTPAIAGAPVGAIGDLKIDLTRLFGGDTRDAVSQAVAERDRELIADGRGAVGTSVGLAKRQINKEEKPKDDLDKLMDALDSLVL